MKTPYISGIIIAVFLLSCGQQPETPAAPLAEDAYVVALSPEQLSNAGLETGHALLADIPEVLQLNGRITVPPQQEAIVSFPIAAYVLTTDVREGMTVQKGSRLATVRDLRIIGMQEEYLTVRNDLALAKRELSRHEALAEGNAISQKALEETTARVQSLQIRSQSLREQLSIIGIDADKLNADNVKSTVQLVAPMSGIITQIHAHPGMYADATQPLFEMISTGELMAELTVFEHDLSRIASGQTVEICLTGTAGTCATARVDFINPKLDEQHTSRITCTFTGAANGFYAGQSVTASLTTHPHTSLTLPLEALVRWENQPFVFVRRPAGDFRMTPVETGLQSDSLVEVINGISGTDEVVTRNAFTLLMALRNREE